MPSTPYSRWRVKRLTEELQDNVAGTMVVARALIMIGQTGQYRAGRDCAAFTGPNHAFKFAFKGAQPCDALSDIGELTTGSGVNGGSGVSGGGCHCSRRLAGRAFRCCDRIMVAAAG